MSALILIPILPFILLGTLFGVYAYRDAKEHEMNVAFWTIFSAICIPMGIIIYMIVRSKREQKNTK